MLSKKIYKILFAEGDCDSFKNIVAHPNLTLCGEKIISWQGSEGLIVEMVKQINQLKSDVEALKFKPK